MQPTQSAAGLNGELGFDGSFVTITRRGAHKWMLGAGEKRIPLAQITAVQWKDSGPFTRGFIEFTIGGGNEVQARFGRQVKDQLRNENAVVFLHNQEQPFRALREAVDAALADLHTPSAGGGSDVATQLQQLSSLHSQGVLTDTEFQAAKARVLGT